MVLSAVGRHRRMMGSEASASLCCIRGRPHPGCLEASPQQCPRDSCGLVPTRDISPPAGGSRELHSHAGSPSLLTSGSPCHPSTSGAGSRRVGQWCKVRPVSGGPETPGSSRKITRTTSSATSMRLTRVQMMSRFVAQSASASRSCTIAANRSSLPMTRCSERTCSSASW
jgi:hypothetical protein